MSFASVNDLDIHFRLEGDGAELIVLVNGLADEVASYDLQAAAFTAAGYRVLRFDNRGVGRTSKPTGPYSTALLADDLKGLVDGLGLSPFHLVGVSMGGMIAQEYALAHPADLASVTLACTYAEPGPFCSRMFALWADLARFASVSTVMRDVTLWAFTPEFFAERPAEAEQFDVAMSMIDQPLPAYLAQLASIQAHSATDRLHQLATPALVLAGERDILIPVAQSRRLYEALPHAQWELTRGGHACLWEFPEEFNSAVLDFVDRHRKARP